MGTLGAVMSSPQPGKADAYIALTAGHVIPNGDDYLLVKNQQLDSYISLKVAPRFRRFQDQPLYRLDEARSFLDDVGILLVGNDDVKYFSRRIANLNVHYFATQGYTASDIDMTDPLSLSRRSILEQQLNIGPIIVYKVGATTDLTMGRFVTIRDVQPKGWYKPEDEKEKEDDEDDEDDEDEEDEEDEEGEDEDEEVAEKEDDEWLGVVEWMDGPLPSPVIQGALYSQGRTASSSR